MSGLVPKLRFKQDDGSDFPAWEEKRLGALCSFLSGNAFKSELFSDVGEKLITPKNFTNYGHAFFSNKNTKYTIEKVSDKFICNSGDLLVLLTDLTQSCELLGKPIILRDIDGAVLLNQRILKIIPKKELSITFLKEFLLTDQYADFIKQTATGTTVRHSSVKIIGNVKFALPSLSEQQKIADFLSSVDAKIDAVKRKRDTFERYKKGLMQQIFSQKIRFKQEDGSDFPEWEESRLGDVAAVKTGSRDTQNRISNGKYPFFVRSDTIERIDTYAHDGEAILTSGDGVGVGKNIHYMNGKFDYHQRVYAIYQFTLRLDGKFFYHYFKEHFYQRVIRLSAKNSVDSVRMSMITDMPIPLPDLKEQKKIADFLSSIDAKIDAIKTQVEKLEAFKKGLLQQMFV